MGRVALTCSNMVMYSTLSMVVALVRRPTRSSTMSLVAVSLVAVVVTMCSTMSSTLRLAVGSLAHQDLRAYLPMTHRRRGQA